MDSASSSPTLGRGGVGSAVFPLVTVCGLALRGSERGGILPSEYRLETGSPPPVPASSGADAVSGQPLRNLGRGSASVFRSAVVVRIRGSLTAEADLPRQDANGRSSAANDAGPVSPTPRGVMPEASDRQSRQNHCDEPLVESGDNGSSPTLLPTFCPQLCSFPG